MKLFAHVLRLSILAWTSALLAADEPSLPRKSALDAITAEDLLKHINVLGSDEFEGRSPGTKGADLSVKYITDQLKSLGLKPGNPNGTYTHEVPLAGITSAPIASFTIKDKTTTLRFPMSTWLPVRDCSCKSM